MTVISSLTNAAALTGAEFLPTSIAGQPAKRATVSAVAALAQPAIMLRSAFSTTTTNRSNYIMSGYSSVGDYGAGALYSSTGATSSGPMAISDAVGVVFNYVPENSIANAHYFGAVGDGATDDTTALQNALTYITASIPSSPNAIAVRGISLHIPTGRYITTSKLTLGVSNLPEQADFGLTRYGITVYGNGAQYRTGNGPYGGTAIVYTGTSATAILEIDNSIYLHLVLRDMMIFTERPDVSTSGPAGIAAASVTNCIYIPSTNNGLYNFKNLHLWGCTNAIKIENSGGSGNGEDYLFENVWSDGCENFYHNADTTDQSYTHTFLNCGANLYPTGAYFTHNGAGLSIFGFSATGRTQQGLNGGSSTNAISNTTLFRAASGVSLNAGPVNMHGARIESLTQIWAENTLDTQTRSLSVLDNVQCIMDNTAASGATTNTVGNMFVLASPNLISCRSCTFDFSTAGTTLTVSAPSTAGGLSWIVDFDKCNFNQATSKPDTLATTFPGQVKFRDCQYTNNTWPFAPFSQGDYIQIFTAARSYETIWNLRDATSNTTGAAQFSYLTVSSARIAAVTGASALSGMKSNSAVPYQTKVYFEFTTGVTAPSGSVVIGVVDGSYSFAAGLGTTGGVGVAYNNNGSVVCNSVALLAANSVTAIAAGQTGGMAIDLVNMTVYVRNVTNVGNWNNSGSANPATNTGGLAISSAGTTNPMKIACQLMTNAASITMIPQGSSLTPGGGYNNWNSIAYVPIGTP